MARKQVKNDYPFYQAILAFYKSNKGMIRKHYRDVTKKFLDYNDKSIRSDAFLREPQFEALEIYVFIKEYLYNQSVKDMFADWYNKKGGFELRDPFSKRIEDRNDSENLLFKLIDDMTADVYNDVFDQLSVQNESYPNYIYALTMGLGKTILMATCIFYEFILAYKFPKDDKYCHNALVFAPDKTVLQSLREIKTFDMKKVVPPEYLSFLSTNVSFHYLDDKSTTLNTIDGSDYNIIISNTQKVILKTKHKEKSASEKLFDESIKMYEEAGIDDFTKSLYGDVDMMRNGEEVAINQRFQKIIRLKQLGIYVDEAHHLFGTELRESLSDKEKETSLRFTINKIAEALSKNSEKVVACFNYTGTPYVENKILPEVVYTFGLKDAIYDGYLKEVDPNGYAKVKDKEFLKIVLTDFFDIYKDNIYEGLLPKIAIYSSTVKELETKVRPEVEGILNDIGIDTNTILVNVNESKDSDIKEFNDLDVVGTEGSKKQVILLVDKGKEGWNCRSLFAVALFRSPKSKNFVLQSTMRCLRQITDTQQTAKVYLSEENYNELESELQKNFNVNIKELKQAKDDKIDVPVHIVKPDKTIRVDEIKKKYTLEEKTPEYKFDINLDKIDVEKYKSIHIEKKGLNSKYSETKTEFVSEENRHYSKYTIAFEIARYLNKSPLYIKDILDSSGKFDEIENIVSSYNDILFDVLIPKMFEYLYNLKEETINETKEIPLIKYRKDTDHFMFRSKRNLFINIDEHEVRKLSDKSFHVDNYCFDSEPEKVMFLKYLNSDAVSEVYFTGMFTGSENGLSVQYIDPNSNIIRTYYPDILVFYKDGRVEIVEVKGDNMVDKAEVDAKAYAAMELASASKMDYNMYKSSDIMSGKVDIR